MRRTMIGAAAGVVLALAAASGVFAYWQAQAGIDAGVVTSGDLDITAQWQDGVPQWSALYPGDTTSDAVIHVVVAAEGTGLRWRLRVTSEVSSAVSPYTTFAAWNGLCGGGPGSTTIPAQGLGPYSADREFDICIRYSLAADASSDNALQGVPFAPRIDVRAEQVSQ